MSSKAQPERALGEFGLADVSLQDRTTAYSGFFSLDRYRVTHARHDGGPPIEVSREVLQRPAAVAVLPYDPDRDRVILIEQFRIGAFAAGVAPWLLEAIAGLLEPNEMPPDVARREAREEAGLDLIDLVPVYSYLPSPGGCSEMLHLYVGRTDSTHAGGVHGLAEEGEDIRVHVLPVSDVYSLLINGHVRDAQTIVALQWLILNYETLRRRWADPPKVRRRSRSGRPGDL